MKWYKEVAVDPLRHRFGRQDQMMLWGSCFAQELQKYLYRHLYHVHFAPFGIMYNPLSMAEGLRRVLAGDLRLELIEHDGAWHSLMHHGIYSHHNPEVAQRKILGDFEETVRQVADTQLWVFTFGTAYIYEWEETGVVVNNCHRLPSNRFRRRRVAVEEVVEAWEPLLLKLRATGAEVIFTVSPIPHYRDGAHANRLSKATLLLAIDALIGNEVHYFPSYEIQLDELRDYRFFEEDMAHPTPAAVQHILSKFADFALSPEEEIGQRWEQLLHLAQHRPMTSDPKKRAAHHELVAQKLATFANEISHPYVQELASQIEELL